MERAGHGHLNLVGGRLLAVDNTRFWCMFAVVALHCTRVFTVAGQDNCVAAYVAATLFKFGTIGFFLVSGFLLEPDLARNKSQRILGRRIRKVLVPWAVWFALSLALFAWNDLVRRREPFQPGFHITAALASEIAHLMTATSLWFVPNLLLCLCCLLAFRKFVHRLEFGLLLLLVNLFYVANIYMRWIASLHTEALFGFVFYLWLGHFAASHRDRFAGLLKATPGWLLYAAILLAAAAAFGESRLLLRLGAADPLNTLRLSNQAFSVLVVLGLCRLPRPTWPRFVSLPRHMFGIYLSHSIIVAGVLTCVRRALEQPAMAGVAHLAWLRILVWAGATLAGWTVGFLLTRQLAASGSLAWTFGLEWPRKSSRKPAHSTPPETMPNLIAP